MTDDTKPALLSLTMWGSGATFLLGLLLAVGAISPEMHNQLLPLLLDALPPLLMFLGAATGYGRVRATKKVR